MSREKGVESGSEEKLEVICNFSRHPCVNLFVTAFVYYLHKLRNAIW